ncbi:MAG: GNAT family N-acetyltransferase [Chitinophagaceae bacterium]|jgi:ElaA protein
MNNIIWTLKDFAELNPFELYQILRLRSEVFVVEQNCIFLDLDDLDAKSQHLQGRSDGELIAYVRILPPGLAYSEPSIGRVVTSPQSRRMGAGKALMKKAIEETEAIYPNKSIKIGAQLYLKKFYEGFGFEQCSEVYLEDGIEHIKMLRN